MTFHAEQNNIDTGRVDRVAPGGSFYPVDRALQKEILDRMNRINRMAELDMMRRDGPSSVFFLLLSCSSC